MTMTTSTTKSPVLVILPPTHQCADLAHVLKLARKAFDDLSLNILDLNLRFAWVSGDELLKDEPSTSESVESKPGAVAAVSTTRGKHSSDAQVSFSSSSSIASMPARPVTSPPAAPPSVKPGKRAKAKAKKPKSWQDTPASLDASRLFISGFVHTLNDNKIMQVVPPFTTLTGATIYPPCSVGPGNAKVRTAVFASDMPKQIKALQRWITHEVAKGRLANKFAAGCDTDDLARYLEPGETPECRLNYRRSDLLLATDLCSTLDALPASQPTAWKVTVCNLASGTSNADILAHIVPRKAVLCGATFYPPFPTVAAHSSGSVLPAATSRSVTLAFKSKDHADYCSNWIQQQVHEDPSFNSLATLACNITATKPTKQVHNGPRAIDIRDLDLPPSTLTALLSLPPARDSSFSASSLPEANRASKFRITIGNLLDSASKDELAAALIPPGVLPVGMTLTPLRQLQKRPGPELVRFVALEFASKFDAKVGRDWVQAQAVKGGSVAKLIVRNKKVVLLTHF